MNIARGNKLTGRKKGVDSQEEERNRLRLTQISSTTTTPISTTTIPKSLKMRPFFILDKLLQVPDSVALGRLVLNPDYPHQEYCPAIDKAISKADIIESDEGILETTLSATKHKACSARFLKLLEASHVVSSKHDIKLNSIKRMSYVLKNQDDLFTKALADQETRRWIEQKRAAYPDMYFIIGYETVLNLTVSQHKEDKTSGGGGIAVIPYTPQDGRKLFGTIFSILDSSILKRKESSDNFEHYFEGERVCGVRYRKLKFKWYGSGDIALKPHNSWVLAYGKSRSKLRMSLEMIEVDLNDLASEADDADWVECHIGGVDYIFGEDDGYEDLD